MRGISFILVAAVFLASAAPGGIVRSCVFPASECGEPAPQAGGRLVLPSFDGGSVAVTLGGRTESVTGHASFGGRADGAILRNATVVETPSGFVATVTDERTRNVLVFRWDGESLRVVERISTLISPAFSFSVFVKTFPSPSFAARQARAVRNEEVGRPPRGGVWHQGEVGS